MKRPELRVGDLVRNKIPRPPFGSKMFRVVRIEVPEDEKMKLGFHRRTTITSREGFVLVFVEDKSGARYMFRRRDLWRIPNQPLQKSKRIVEPNWDHLINEAESY